MPDFLVWKEPPSDSKWYCHHECAAKSKWACRRQSCADKQEIVRLPELCRESGRQYLNRKMMAVQSPKAERYRPHRGRQLPEGSG